MSRKIKADDIFSGTTFTGPGHVLIVDDEGVIEALVPEAEAGEDAEFLSGILCPGFINAHCHIELSHLKNKIAQHTGLVNFVQNVMTQRAASDKEKQAAMQEAEAELFSSGTVAVGDICNTADSANLKERSKLYWHSFIEISGFVDAGAQKRFDDAKEIQSAYTSDESSLSPHAPYSVSKKLFSLINDASSRQLISIHNQESPAENELYKKGSGDFLSLYNNFGIDISNFKPTGKTSFETWLPYFNNDQKIISVHNTFINQPDLNSALNSQHSKLFFCICPNANLYIENGLPPIDLLMKNNCKIVLGTDSYASNTQLNIFEEIKTLRENFPEVPFAKILQWATMNGAEALGIDSKFGSFEKGKQPGMVVINKDEAHRFV